MKQIFSLMLLLSFVITTAFTCTKDDLAREQQILAPYEKCQMFDLTTHSGHFFHVATYSIHTDSLYKVIFLKFNSDTVVIAVDVMYLDKRDVRTITYNYHCYPSNIP